MLCVSYDRGATVEKINPPGTLGYSRNPCRLLPLSVIPLVFSYVGVQSMTALAKRNLSKFLFFTVLQQRNGRWDSDQSASGTFYASSRGAWSKVKLGLFDRWAGDANCD
jgi:hypothetical protein